MAGRDSQLCVERLHALWQWPAKRARYGAQQRPDCVHPLVSPDITSDVRPSRFVWRVWYSSRRPLMRYSSSDSAGSWGTCYPCTGSYYSYQVRYTNRARNRRRRRTESLLGPGLRYKYLLTCPLAAHSRLIFTPISPHITPTSTACMPTKTIRSASSERETPAHL